nr:ATP synthase F0 subunit 8 [Anaticola crassicornis]
MPQMMPIWWSMMLIMSVMLFLCMSSIMYFTPLLNLKPLDQFSVSSNKKLVITNHDL